MMFHYNESQSYMLMQMHQEQMRREFQVQQRNRQQLREALSERTAERQFRLMYRVRHWMHRLAPGLARTML